MFERIKKYSKEEKRKGYGKSALALDLNDYFKEKITKKETNNKREKMKQNITINNVPEWNDTTNEKEIKWEVKIQEKTSNKSIIFYTVITFSIMITGIISNDYLMITLGTIGTLIMLLLLSIPTETKEKTIKTFLSLNKALEYARYLEEKYQNEEIDEEKEK